MFIQTTIGRNVTVTLGGRTHSEPMPNEQWDAFNAEVGDALLDTMVDLTGLSLRQLRHTDAAYEVHTGRGHWDTQGEESTKHAVYFPVSMVETTGPETAQIMVALNRHLRELAVKYGQDAIHIVTGGKLLHAKDAKSQQVETGI